MGSGLRLQASLVRLAQEYYPITFNKIDSHFTIKKKSIISQVVLLNVGFDSFLESQLSIRLNPLPHFFGLTNQVFGGRHIPPRSMPCLGPSWSTRPCLDSPLTPLPALFSRQGCVEQEGRFQAGKPAWNRPSCSRHPCLENKWRSQQSQMGGVRVRERFKGYG